MTIKERCRYFGCDKEADFMIELEMSYGAPDKQSFMCKEHKEVFEKVNHAFFTFGKENLGSGITRVSIYTAEKPYKIIDTYS